MDQYGAIGWQVAVPVVDGGHRLELSTWDPGLVPFLALTTVDQDGPFIIDEALGLGCIDFWNHLILHAEHASASEWEPAAAGDVICSKRPHH